jgi:membrane protease YdiL (CAAX protease family)
LARFVPSEWRAFGAFIARPALPERMTGIHLAALGKTLQLFGLDLLLMALLVGAIGVATTFGFHIPENDIDKLVLGPKWLAIIIVAAPLGEELVFRSWVSGRPAPIAAVLALLVGLALPIASGPQAHPILLLGSLAIAGLVAIALAIWLRKRPAFTFFSRHFVWFYFASALLFALAHLGNYSQGAMLLLLPLVVPQLIAGLVFGYARVTYGLWSDMLLHMLHNGLLISLVVLQKGLG